MSVERRVKKERGKNGCWTWTGTVQKLTDYPVMMRDGVIISVRRFIYEKLIQKLPEGMMLFRRCKNKRCVNPEHMRVVKGRKPRSSSRSKS